uniref:Uncharacterized protein n=1 Tax=Rhizophora mucronata TaxID=61149 RepID=A0A2P2QJE3_RHIMU
MLRSKVKILNIIRLNPMKSKNASYAQHANFKMCTFSYI